MTKKTTHKHKLATELIHVGSMRSKFNEMSESIFLTQGFIFNTAEEAEARFNEDDTSFIYSRISNPTTAMFEDRMAKLYGAESACATASGMSAVTASILSQVTAGDHVVASRVLFGACRFIIEDLLPKFGVEYTLVDGGNLDQWRSAMRPNTKTCFLETPTNPTIEVYDISAIADIVHRNGATLIVDNALASPILQNPLKLGADCVVYSATKHIDGQGRCLAGVVLGSGKIVGEGVHQFLRRTGPSISPFNSWVMLKSLETLLLRVEAQKNNAQKVAEFLFEHPKVTHISYPGLPSHPQYSLAKRQMKGGGTVIAFEVEGGKDGAFKFCNGLSLIKISNNFGDAKSIITHPATTTHKRLSAEVRAEMGISDSLLRLSIGLEDIEDLIIDIQDALSED